MRVADEDYTPYYNEFRKKRIGDQILKFVLLDSVQRRYQHRNLAPGALFHLMEGRTSFVIAPRLNTIWKEDQVLVINNH
jgi:hypothetical protein